MDWVLEREMEQGRIVLFMPRHAAKKVAAKSSNVSILEINNDDYRYWFLDENRIDLETFENFSMLLNLQNVISELRSWGSIFSRYYDDLPKFELELREIALIVIRLANFLKAKKTRFVVMPTGASHHVDSLICELSCRLAQIPQVFQYLPAFGGRILPLVQLNGIQDRKLLGLQISDTNFDEIIPNLSIANWRAPNFDNAGNPQSSFIASLLKILSRRVRFGLHKTKIIFLNLPPRTNKNLIGFNDIGLKKYGIISELRSMQRHISALKYLQTLISKDEKIVDKLMNLSWHSSENSTNALLPIFFAHYQPEATSFPEGGEFANHIDAISNIRGSGYKGPLVYKEHPGIWMLSTHGKTTRVGTARSVSYYKQLQQLGCLFADNSLELNEKSKVLPITLTGSVALERSLQGLKTLVMGRPWFVNTPGIIHYRDSGLMPDLLNFTKLEGNIAQQAVNYLSENLRGTTLKNALIYHSTLSISKKEMQLFDLEYSKFLYQLSFLQLKVNVKD